MKHLFIISGLLFLLFSCTGGSHTKIPADVIKPDSMAALLTEVHILQASLQLGYTRNDSAISANEAFDDLWKKHHITRNDYNRYVTFYTRHPELLDSIYEKVMSNISEQKAETLGKIHH